MEIILIIFIIFIIFTFYFAIRNDKVYYFKRDLSDLLLDELRRIIDTYKNDNEFHEDENNYYNIREKTYSLLNKYSYEKYLFSFKSLKLEKWFNKEELEFINYLKQYRK